MIWHFCPKPWSAQALYHLRLRTPLCYGCEFLGSRVIARMMPVHNLLKYYSVLGM
jgi:hypothetical protein